MLAFNIQGERFQPPASATSWRVRRLKPGGRGTPDIIFGGDGAPLLLPVETELADFREAVRNAPGRYRLDAVDDDCKSCEGGVPAYLQVSKEASAPTASTVAPQATATSGGTDSALIEMLVRTNTEMVKSITERFASVMDSAALLIRAADGAGMPSREPSALAAELATAVRNAAPVEGDVADAGDDEDGGEPEPYNPVKSAIDGAKEMLPIVLPLINAYKASKQPVASQPTPVEPPRPASQRNAAPSTSEEQAAESEVERPSAADFTQKVMAVAALLPPEDIGAAQAAIMSMPEEEQAGWQARLMAMSNEDAAAVVKTEIAKRKAISAEATQKEEAA